jgi:hypothetical protein
MIQEPIALIEKKRKKKEKFFFSKNPLKILKRKKVKIKENSI